MVLDNESIFQLDFIIYARGEWTGEGLASEIDAYSSVVTKSNEFDFLMKQEDLKNQILAFESKKSFRIICQPYGGNVWPLC